MQLQSLMFNYSPQGKTFNGYLREACFLALLDHLDELHHTRGNVGWLEG